MKKTWIYRKNIKNHGAGCFEATTKSSLHPKQEMFMMMKKAFILTGVSLALSACNLAPKYERPEVELPSSQFRHNKVSDTRAIQAASLGWKDYFADPRLHALIELALKNNTDLRTANLNVEQVRAQYAITRSAELPSLNGSAGATRSGNAQGVGNSFSVGLGISAFELDLWGRVRNSSEAALQSYFATAASRDSTHLSLISTVAKAYFNQQYALASADLAQRVLKTRQETYRLSQLRYRAGVISALDLREQEATIAAAQASYAEAVKNAELARNQIELLISQKIPDNLPAALPLSRQFKIRQLPAGLPSDLLLNRPDIIAAEHNMKQANANIGAARANFFPRISLTGSLGLGSPQLSNLFNSGSKSWSFGGSAGLPIFDWGSNSANLDAAKIAQQKTVVAYEAAVESAFREVSDALAARSALNAQYNANVTQSKAFADRLRLVRLRYRHGVSSSLDLLDAERSNYSASSSLLATELSLLENMADLYKVLGGGLKRYTHDTPDTAVQAASEAR